MAEPPSTSHDPHDPHDSRDPYASREQRDAGWWRRLARRFSRPISASVTIVDPDAALAVALKYDLGGAFRVAVALNAGGALPLLKADPPDVLVFELDLPDMDGLAFLRAARSQPGMQQALVIVLSARATLDDKLAAFALGVDDYLVKPVTATRLREHIERLVRFRQVLTSNPSGPTGRG